MSALNATNLSALGPDVAIPAYDRDHVRVGIVHLGVGGFHRAHQAMYIDELMNAGLADDWAICGVGVLDSDRRMKDVMDAQDGLYTLVLKRPDGSTHARVIGSIVEYVLASDDPEAAIERMADPETKIVSLTVTEGGYNIDHVTGEFDSSHPDVVHDLTPGTVPRTTFGLITAALERRRQRELPAYTLMSCDNIAGNGHMARSVFTAFARAKDAGLADWVEREVRFPNSMVDRITPVTTDQDRALVTEQYGVDDAWPVVCEPFTQCVLEDDFGFGRPALEHAGVQLVADVEPYELMKLRLLNASHQGLCYFAYLAGYRLVHEACQDPLIRTFLRAYMDTEATPTLPPVPGVDLEEYKSTLIERFANPGVRDTVARLCAESSDRIPKWLLPVARDNLRTGGPVTLSAAIVASWARYAEGVDEQGEPIEIVDQLAERLIPAARRQRDEPLAFLADREVFGNLVDQPRFTQAYRSALSSLQRDGARRTLESLV